MTVAPFNLQTELAASQWRGLRINLSRALFLTGNRESAWRADIYRNTETKSGREGVPKKIVTMVSNEGESPADLLRTMAILYEQGDVTIGAEL